MKTTLKVLPTWLVKAAWRGTALTFEVQALNEVQAWHKGWGKVTRMLGGDSCMEVKVLRCLNK